MRIIVGKDGRERRQALNPETGELAELELSKAIPDIPVVTVEGQLADYARNLRARTLSPEQAEQEGFIALPEHLNRAARRAIAQGRNPISLTSGGKLSRWARQHR